MSERERLMRRMNAVRFAMWELHIYMDTHPTCQEAAAKYRDYQNKLTDLVTQYESQFGPRRESRDAANRWAWINNPWPWQLGEEDD